MYFISRWLAHLWYGITPDSKKTQYNSPASSLTSWWAALRSKTEPGVSDRDINGLMNGGILQASSWSEDGQWAWMLGTRTWRSGAPKTLDHNVWVAGL